MSQVGQRERATQNRVVKLFDKQLGYDYLGNWEDRLENSNIEEAIVKNYLSQNFQHVYSKHLYLLQYFHTFQWFFDKR